MSTSSYHQQQNIAGNGYIKRLEAVDRRKGGQLYESVWIPVKDKYENFEVHYCSKVCGQ